MSTNQFLIGPFKDYEKNPILWPTKGFQSKRLYNPSVIKEGERFFMFYRAETSDDLTGRIGMAESEDGFHFTCHQEPILIPGDDFDRGGCEDPRVVKLDGIYYMTYVGNSQRYYVSNICLATSNDLFVWKKLGSILSPKQNGWNSGQLKAGALLPERINGKYVMYFMGEEKPWTSAIGIAYSEDLIHWIEPLDQPILTPRPGYFDSQGIEPGPTPLILDEGILLLYNGWGRDCIYKTSQVLFSKEDPTKLLWRASRPILELSKDYGKEFGEGNHCVAEGLVKVGNQWLLYYGAADRFTCLAIYEEKKR